MLEKIDFTKGNGLIPAIIQDADTKAVLMLGYMDQLAVEATIGNGKVTFFSRSKERHWTKGESSGNFLDFVSMELDCDSDTLLVQARPQGPTCHLGTYTCWGAGKESGLTFLSQLDKLIASRYAEANNSEIESESYVVSLFRKGTSKIAQKVGEEAVETVIEAMANNNELLLNESADLLFHLMVLLKSKGLGLRDVVEILEGRHQNGR
jgi:phosphoribosyl-ATP pyrophosphohydrolase/phosphoribosyl-AMP cyclohydrolase